MGSKTSLKELKGLKTDLEVALSEAEDKAIDALARYNFQMFGYWAAIWVHLNRVGRFKRKNPFKKLVKSAREIKENQPVPF